MIYCILPIEIYYLQIAYENRQHFNPDTDIIISGWLISMILDILVVSLLYDRQIQYYRSIYVFQIHILHNPILIDHNPYHIIYIISTNVQIYDIYQSTNRSIFIITILIVDIYHHIFIDHINQTMYCIICNLYIGIYYLYHL